ncbi:hypothetical protein HHI36_005902 [Cryptolaemus montrouzieri]|uniref:DM10 domain-containing protein n=2 Tax=Cryptolaemus montrouzieri TaxID=559131 RepID=A0ABD2NWL2_9CUCU
MTGLPKLPGLTFTDPTITNFKLSHTLDTCAGYSLPKSNYLGIGGRELEINTAKYITKSDPVRYDPSLTYGRTRAAALPQFTPHYVHYDAKCLTFRAFFKQTVVESPLEHYRIRQVNLIYFLSDDTIVVIEPKTPNAGMDQGKLVRRARIPKNNRGEYWTWKDLGIGKDIAIHGTVYHTVDCDIFTREYMASQGLIMGDPEEMPFDPYTMERALKKPITTTRTPPADNKLRRFLEYDRQILKFNAVWDDRDSEHGELRKFDILYFLSDDTICVKEIHTKNDGRDPFPLLLRRTKIPKIYTDIPINYPALYLELSDAEVTEFYQPIDFKVGDTIFILGRKMLLYDCDSYTRNYYSKALCIEQKPAMPIEQAKPPPLEHPMPPHDGIGSLEDSLQNTLSFMPKPPRKDVIRQISNANKFLRYEMVMENIHPEDTIRKFLLLYSLGDGTCKIHEPPISNSGIIGGKYLRATHLVKPGSDPLDPTYYTPGDFYIGAVITVFQQRFIITGADLYVYRYMQANPEKFPCCVIENMRNYMFHKGYLKEDIKDQIQESLEQEKKEERDAIGQDIEEKKTTMEVCYGMKTPVDEEYERMKKAELAEAYERSIEHTSWVPPHGIKPIDQPCPFEINVGKVEEEICEEPTEGEVYTPKHIDTPEEKLKKYYSNILKKHHDICEKGNTVECKDPDELEGQERPPKTGPLMVNPPELPPNPCNIRKVRFNVEMDRCARGREDLCDMKREKTTCDCTDYKKS